MTWLDSLRERSRRTRLGVKLGWLTAGLTALVVFLSFVGLTVRIRGNTRRLFADELARNQRAVARVQRRSLEQLLAEANLVTAVPGVNAVLSEWQQDELQGRPVRRDLANTVNEAFSEYLRRVDKDVLIATDDSGRVVASVVSGGLPLPAGTTLATMPAVRRALDPTAPADSGSLAVLRTPHDVFQVAVFPLVMPDGRTLGAVVLGERLEPGVVKLAQDGFSGQVVVTAGRELVTEPTPSFGEGDIPTLNASAAASGTPGPVTIRGQEAIAAMVDLGRTQDGTPVRLWLLQELAPTVRALTHPVFVDFVVYGLLAVIIAGLGGALMSRSVLDPLTRFVAFLHSAAGGEPSAARFDAGRASVEVRALNDSFTELMDSLAVKQRQLEHRTEELAAANADLTSEARERRRVELALRESEAQLRQSQKLEAVGTLAGGIAHDFNNLLTVISGYSQLALRRAGSGTEDADDLKQVVDAADRAARLTQQLLAFSRKQVLKPTVLDLAEVAEGVAPMLRRLIGEHIDLRIARDEALARVMADRGQVEQVIINLVVNARDAMPTGGTITIRIANAPDPVDANRPPVGVVLSVRDTGTGIPPEVRERIFEPFFTTKEVGKGTGLGLSTVYGIVTQSGGTIDVDSAPGAGTTFRVMLPAADELSVSGVLPERADHLPHGTETVLVVEDEPAVRALTVRTLKALGYTVHAAEDPASALELARDARVQVVLTDIVMPQMSGPDLVARLVQRRPAPAVVYMTGYADDALQAFAMDSAATLLRKPFTPSVLARAIRDALDAPRTPHGTTA